MAKERNGYVQDFVMNVEDFSFINLKGHDSAQSYVVYGQTTKGGVQNEKIEIPTPKEDRVARENRYQRFRA